MALADPSEILITRTVQDLVAGKRIAVDGRGSHELKGIPSRWDVFAVEEVEGRPRPPPIDPGVAQRSANAPPVLASLAGGSRSSPPSSPR